MSVENGVQQMMVLLSTYTITDANKIVKIVNEKLSKMASAAQAPTTDSGVTQRAPQKTTAKPGRR